MIMSVRGRVPIAEIRKVQPSTIEELKAVVEANTKTFSVEQVNNAVTNRFV